ncbi:MAG: hypothetical protein KUG82_10585 [Pseudomonadales bacterium]|nr:hypothetical protein [Pseudomonadales bacterium]
MNQTSSHSQSKSNSGSKLLTLIGLTFLISNSFPANAFSFDKPVQLSGFLSFGGGLTDAKAFPGGDDPNDPEDEANPSEDTPRYTAGSGHFILDDTLSFDQDTKAGLQLDFTIDEKTSATLQFISYAYANNFQANLSWAYISYSLIPDLVFRGGRFRLPIYFTSDYLDIGVAYTWITPPTEVYSTINMSNLTGVDLLYSRQVGNWVWATQPFLGTSKFERDDFQSVFKNLLGINSSLNQENIQLRIAYMKYEYSIQPWPLGNNHALLIQQLLDAGMTNLEENINPNGSTTEFLTFGLSWHKNRWGVQTEWAKRNNTRSLPDIEGYYITLLYQYRHWQPHITFAARKELNESSRFHPDLAQLSITSPLLATFTETLIHSATNIEDNEIESITIGLTVSFSDYMIGKFELSEIRNIESTGFFEFATKHDKNHILKFAIDLTF